MNLAVRISLLCVALFTIRCDNSGTPESVPQQFDPEILKTFPKWSITFHGIAKYSNGSSEREGDIVRFNNYDVWNINILFPIKWLGATSTVDTSYVYSSPASGGSGGGSSYYRNLFYSYQATIADTNTVSGSCHTLYSRQETYGRNGGGGYHELYLFSMKYSEIPLRSFSNDSVVFYLSGDSLQAKVSEIKREEGSVSPDYKLTDILWDKQPVPSLTIVYYK